MFKQLAAHRILRKLLVVLGVFAGLVFSSAAGMAQSSTYPSCDYVVQGTMDKRYTWESGAIVCYNIEFREFTEVFVIAVKALDSGGKYDVYLDSGWSGEKRPLATKINRNPIKKAQKTVRLVFNRDTFDLEGRYTVALVPRPGYETNSRAALLFTTEEVWGASRPQENSGDLGWIPSSSALDSTVTPKGLADYLLDVSCPGTVTVTALSSIMDSSDPDPQVTVKLFEPDGSEAWSETKDNALYNKTYRVTESHIRQGTSWHLQFKNRGDRPIAVSGLVRMPDDNCAPISVKRTATFQYSGTAGEAFDVTLEQADRDQNFMRDSQCYVDGDDSGYERNTLLFWDVSSIPYGSKITKATVQLTVFNESEDSYYVYDVKRNWHPYMATWDHATDNKPWSRGGATGSSDRGSVVGTLSARNTGTATISLDPAVVQKWVNGHVVDNDGLLIANSQADDGIDFYCMEATSKSQRPKLIVEYES